MNVLLDNCVHYKSKRLFAGHDVRHTRDLDWEDLANGRLLAAAAGAGFDVFVTADKNIRHQQRLDALPLPVVELNCLFNRLRDLMTLAPHPDAALAATAGYRFVSVSPHGVERLSPR